MGGLRTISLILACVVPTLSFALPWSPSERVQLFATCAGRYAALAEHERFFDGSASDRALHMQGVFEDLIEATLPEAVDWGMPGRQALTWHVTAKMATATLLNSADFGTSARRREISHDAADAYLTECRNVVLGT